MNKYHQELRTLLKKEANINGNVSKQPKGYTGDTHAHYHLKMAQIRLIAKKWQKQNNLGSIELSNILDALYHSKVYDEIIIASIILSKAKELRASISLAIIETWLEQLEGWAEIDTLCTSCFNAKELLARWEEWGNWLKKLNRSNNIVFQRASLVFLVKPVRESTDSRLSNLAFSNIENVKEEKDKLVTKAVSWLLRALIKNNQKKVENYLEEESKTLPAIAVRETKNKLKTGKK